MFNVEDKEMIMNIVNNRKENELVIPLYVRVGNIRYSLFEVDEIPDCSPSIFKIGFGSSNSVFTRIKFPNDRLMYFSEAKLFNHFDEDKQILIQYITFESSDVEDDGSILNENINRYYDILLEYVMSHVEINKKERIKKTIEELS